MESLKNEDAKKNKSCSETDKDIARVGVALSTSETVNRYGSASAEFIKGYRGVDNETGTKFAKGLKQISEHKLNEKYKQQNIKQQAGYSAEVAATSRDNAEAIIKKSKIRTSRSDDLSQYGKNHNVVDRVQILDGKIIEGTQTQMKFVGNRDQLLSRIAKEDGMFARYRGTIIELSSEQYKGASEHCHQQAKDLFKQAESAKKLGKHDVAAKHRQNAENYKQLASKLADSGLTTDQAINYRLRPTIATALDIGRTSHNAGMDGAQYGALIGSCISLMQNSFSASQGQKKFNDAAKDVVVDVAKAGALGYSTAFAGSAIKGVMQQSGAQTVRTLANTSLPVLIVSSCMSLSGSIQRFAVGEITESELLTEVGEKGAGMLSSGMMAAVGQLAIPIPVVGAVIGGMVGYTLSSFFYKSALEAAQGVELSRDNLERVKAIQTAARERIALESTEFNAFVSREIPLLKKETQAFFTIIDTAEFNNTDRLIEAVNDYAELLGESLLFKNRGEFDSFMSSTESFKF